MKKLRSITAFWNNEGNDGLAVQFKGEDLQKLLAIMEINIKLEDPDPQPHLDLLKVYAEQRILTESQKSSAVMTIMHLEKIGAVPNDNFNGMLYIWE